MIQKDLLLGVRLEQSLLEEVAQQASSLWPQWAKAFLPTLTEQADLKRLCQLTIASAEIQYLLNAGAGIEQCGQQSEVAPAVARGLLHYGAELLGFFVLHIFDRRLSSSLEEK